MKNVMSISDVAAVAAVKDGISNPLIIMVSIFADAEQQIQAKWKSLGGSPGLPVVPGREGLVGAGDGFYREYGNGRIYWSPSTNAHEVHGAILDKWLSLGAEHSFLGYPVGDETGTPDGVGRFNRFQHGMIYWTPSIGAHEIHGAILDKWSSIGFENSFLGYPVSDELDLGFANGRFSNFERGQIAWTPIAGAAVSSSSFVADGAGGIRPQGVDPNGKPEIRRRVVASAHMAITDDETFGSNEHGTADGRTEGFVTNTTTPSTFLNLIGKAGGEVRVELNLNVSATTEGDVQISGNVQLFEGTSTESDDLDGTTGINFTVPRDGIITQRINVRNTDEGGDFSDIDLTISNFAA
uniref:LGFP repeat-containing protein n=1 Tax=Roseihalotalea indica TaxID=2867963 RepID=A0AA49JJE6_9BACT|nr:hypothetical protein K4G66_13695 [Tunicatimonas sp. TK19036]